MKMLLLFLLTFALAQMPVPDAYSPTETSRSLLPLPQEETRLPESFSLHAGVTLYLLHDTPLLQTAAAALNEDIRRYHGFALTVQTGETPPAGSIVVGVDSSHPSLNLAGVAPVTQAEGYVLRVDPGGITIAGADERGAFYGLQTLRQVMVPGADVPGVLVRDWPALPLRVAMIYLDSASDSLNGRLIPLLAAHKYNTLLIMSNYVHWDSAPELHVPGGATKAAAQNVARLAREYGLEPIPLLETLGHVEWLFANAQNRDLLGDPNVSVPFAYDPLNPRVYEVLFPILDELIAIFEPRYLHIGHDEVRNVNPFPANERGRQVGFAQLFLDDTLRLYEHLHGRGVKTMIWQDVLLSEEVRPILGSFPSDLAVAAWTYSPAADYPQLRTLKEAGFTVLGASWRDPSNIRTYAQAAAREGVSGMIQTRWTGYFGNASFLEGQFDQASAYLSAAAAFWNPAAPAPDDAALRFRQAWGLETSAPARPGTLVSLTPYGNRTLADPDGSGWLGRGAESDLSAALETTRFGGVRFDLGTAVSLRGSHRRVAEDPESVTLPLGIIARSLAFLHTTGWASPAFGEEVGLYTIRYADGSEGTIPLLYGRNIAAWTETPVSSTTLNQVWRGTTREGLEAALTMLLWDNPKPDVAINEILFSSKGTIANPMLIGLTLLQ